MLILNRRPGESIVIGNNITITLLESSRTAARLGIDCPRDIPVHREEIAERIARGEPAPPRPAVRQTRTYAELDVPPEFHAYVKQRLLEAGYGHAVTGDTIDMHGIVLVLPR